MQNEETKHHYCNIRRLSGLVCRCVAAERASCGNTRTTHTARRNRHTAQSSENTRNRRNHNARGKKADVTQLEPVKEAITAPEPTPTQTPPVREVHAPSEQNATPPQVSEPAPTSPDSTQNNMVYVPGFGWLENQGPNHCEYAEDMYENGNKIGSMG